MKHVALDGAVAVAKRGGRGFAEMKSEAPQLSTVMRPEPSRPRAFNTLKVVASNSNTFAAALSIQVHQLQGRWLPKVENSSGLQNKVTLKHNDLRCHHDAMSGYCTA
jgi:hypothetical protein